MSQVTNIPDAIRDVVTRMNAAQSTWEVKYDFGFNTEIQRILVEKSRNATTKGNKYPYVILGLPYTDNATDFEKDYHEVSTVSVLIATETDKNWKAEERKENNFKAVLWPLYELFISTLLYSNYFDRDALFRIAHSRTDRYFDSTTDAKQQNVFSAYWDAVEITEMELKLQIQHEPCLTN